MKDHSDIKPVQDKLRKGSRSSTRFLELDALRGVAVLAVILFHYSTRYSQYFGHLVQPYPLDFKYGYFGVNLFFIISGFVIFMTLESADRIKEFFFKRFARLYPVYWFAAMLTFVIVKLTALPGLSSTRWELLANLTMFQGFFGIQDVDGAYWSLAMELAFYLLIALATSLKLLKHAGWLGTSWLGVAVLLQLTGLVFQSPILAAFKLFFRDYAAFFVLGMMFYKLYGNGHWRYHLVIAAALIYEVIFQGWLNAGVMALFVAIFYLLIYGKLDFLKNRAIVFIGTISYSLYLVHQNLGYVIIRALENLGLTSAWGLVIPITVMVLLATGITFGIEKPVQRALLKGYSSLRSRSASH